MVNKKQRRVVMRQSQSVSKGLYEKQRLASRFSAWLEHNKLLLKSSIGKLISQPLTSALTWLVISIILTLPMVSYVVYLNASSIAQHWQTEGQISLFLYDNVNERQGHALAGELSLLEDVASAEYISSKKAMQQFEQWSGIGDIIGQLQQNPLPATIIVYPHAINASDIESLQLVLQDMPQVQDMVLDLEWVQRLQNFVDLIKKLVIWLSGLLIVTVSFVIANTIRMNVNMNQQEIKVTRLFGGTNRYIRRPFLYMAMWHALLGSLFAYVIGQTMLWTIASHVREFTDVYLPNLSLQYGGVSLFMFLIVATIMVSWTGAWITVNHQLKRMGLESTSL